MKVLKTVAILMLLAVTFASGYIVRASKRGTSATAARRVLYYVDAMNPAFTSDKPGLAPDAMALQAVYADESETPASTIGERRSASMPPGAIKISPVRQQVIGVRFATAELDGASRVIRTVGKVTFDETRVAHVHTRIDGWIEKVFVDFTGDVVEQGEPMLMTTEQAAGHRRHLEHHPQSQVDQLRAGAAGRHRARRRDHGRQADGSGRR